MLFPSTSRTSRISLLLLTALSGSLLHTAASPASSDNNDWYTQGDFHPRQRIEFTLVNELDFDRVNCPVVIRRDQMPFADLHEMEVTVVDPGLPPSPEPSPERLKLAGGHELRQETNGHALFSQMDDFDKDGVWDELFFVADLKARETRKIHIYIGFNGRGWNPHETHAGIGSYCRHLMPFWESKNVGWKLWFATSVDAYGKRKPTLMSHRLYMENLDGYGVTLLDPALGSDIQTVGHTFGAGAICLFESPDQPAVASTPRFTKLWRESKSPEPFNRGQISDTRYAFDVVFNGPMRSAIRVKTMNWNSDQGSYELEQTYIAYARQNYSTCRVRYTKFLPKHPSVTLGCGIRKKPKENGFIHEGGMLITSGPESVRDPDAGTVTFDVPFIGSALIVRDEYRPEYQFVPEWQGNHAYRIGAPRDSSFEYLIASSWSEGPSLTTHNTFAAYIRQTAQEYNHPVQAVYQRTEDKP